jgi:hypothetical protein
MKWSKQSAEERRGHLGGFVVVTDMMKEANDVLRRCYRRHGTERQASCSFIVGITGVGKSTTADNFLEEIREEYRGTLKNGKDLKIADDEQYDHTMSVTFEKPGHGLVRPVVKVEVDGGTKRQLFSDTLLAIGIAVRAKATTGEMTAIARHQIKEQGIRLIIFDDCQHIAEGKQANTAYGAADVFKALMKQTGVQIVCMGLPHATDFLIENGQLETLKDEELHMKPFDLDLDEDSEYCAFLSLLSEHLPFDRKTLLQERSLALALFKASDGYIGTLTKLVNRAAELAIDEGSKALTIEHLAKVYVRKANALKYENPFENLELTAEAFAEVKQARLADRRAEARKSRAVRQAAARKTPLAKKLTKETA